jgi:hypothetical protein
MNMMMMMIVLIMKPNLSREIENSTSTFLQCSAKRKQRKIKRQIEEII